MGHRGVHPASDDDGVHEVGEELASLSHCPRHYGGGCGGKHKLKIIVRSSENIMKFGINLEEPCWISVIRQLVIEELRSSTEGITLGPIGQPPAQGPVGDPANEDIQHVLDQDVDGILRPEEAEENNLSYSIQFLSESDLTEPASRKANPHCMKKMSMETTMRKNWSVSFFTKSKSDSPFSLLFNKVSRIVLKEEFSIFVTNFKISICSTMAFF